ncbi:MAG: hypothetical protein ACXWJ0_13665, partial [Xanthobacteraceae bacterium]
ANIYFTAKLGATDGHSFQHLAAVMTGNTQQSYADMMLAGGRSVEGNRTVSGKHNKPAMLTREGSVAPKAAKTKSSAKKSPTESKSKSPAKKRK